MRTFAIAFAIVSGSYSSFRNVSAVTGQIPRRPFLFHMCSSKGKKHRENGTDTASAYVNDEATTVQYNYNVMHLVYCTSALYMMMTLTNWYEPKKLAPRKIYNSTAFFTSQGGGVEEIANGSFAIFWVKSATAFSCQFLFLVIVGV